MKLFSETVFPPTEDKKVGVTRPSINTYISGVCKSTGQRMSGRVKRINYDADPLHNLYTLDSGCQLYTFEIDGSWDI